MSIQPQNEVFSVIASVTSAERERLIRLCAHLTGDSGVAEDLAQETLLEAWRQMHKLRDPEGFSRWLSAIARNVCKRWRQRSGQERSQLVFPNSNSEAETPKPEDRIADDFDLEVELERGELATLLDRALALLPSDTRKVLVERYVAESPQAEIAKQLGLSEGAVEARLHRGKLALRRLLTTDLSEEAESYGLIAPDAGGWEETRIWCPFCGRNKLIGRFGKDKDEISFKCPECTPNPRHYISHLDIPSLLIGIKTYRPALSRSMAWANVYFRGNLENRAVPCFACGQSVPLRLLPLAVCLPEPSPSFAEMHTLFSRCSTCGSWGHMMLASTALCLPEGRKFLKEHPRIRALPDREVEASGVPAIVASYRSLTDTATFDVVFARDTFEIIGIHGAPNE